MLLLGASYLFYMSWYWQYAGLILLSTIVDYFIGRQMDATSSITRRKILLLISVMLNLGVLAFFKYFNFFFDTAKSALHIIGIDIPDIYLQLLLPVGISFYTFQTLSYTIDVYRNKISHEPSFVRFAIFVSFFPQLVAGPIIRAKDFLPQIIQPTNISRDNVRKGVLLVFIGLFKKIIIADTLAYLAVDAVFANPAAYSSWDLMLALYGYTFQIYCDFSGYSDIAIGLALLMGITLPINFDRPYLAQTPSDFWRRWHISLSGWLRDYLYIPLGGSKAGKWITWRNLLITMMLGGLWHGASLNFILWGMFHGLILICTRSITIERNWNKVRLLKIFLNFHLIVFSWLLFRVTDMEKFLEYITGILKLSGGSQLNAGFSVLLCIAISIHIFPKNWFDNLSRSYLCTVPVIVQSGVYTGFFFLFIGASIGATAFIYFQF